MNIGIVGSTKTSRRVVVRFDTFVPVRSLTLLQIVALGMGDKARAECGNNNNGSQKNNVGGFGGGQTVASVVAG